MRTPLQILETTLRDGTYEVDFQFTPADTAFLAAGLDQAGFEYIEVCHGNGFGTNRWTKKSKQVRAAASDEEHLAAAQAVVERAKLGVILVVGEGFTPPEDLSALLPFGVKFVRLAYTPDSFTRPDCLAYIDRAKSLGLIVSINLMQTYVLTPSQVAAGAKEMARRGSDWFYIVDSAGGMLPAEVQTYVRAVLDETPMAVGLHAHNNSALAMANTLAAVEAGATFIDSTLQGIGRATGNPSTEQSVLAMQRLGHVKQIDRSMVFRLGDLARSLFAERGNDPTHFISGAIRMHSRFVPALWKIADDRQRAPREFLYQFGVEIARLGAPMSDAFPEAVLATATEATHASNPVPSAKLVKALQAGIDRASTSTLGAAADALFTRAVKRRKTSVLHVVPDHLLPFGLSLPWETAELAGLTIGLPAQAQSGDAGDVVADRKPDVLLLDEGLSAGPKALEGVPVLRHAFVVLIADATVDLVLALEGRTRPVCRIDGDAAKADKLGKMIESRLLERGVELGDPGRTTGPRILLAGRGEGWPALIPGDTVVLYGNARPLAAVDAARRAGARVLRPHLAAAIAGCATTLVKLDRRLRTTETLVGAVDPFVASGTGEIVVDDLIAPAQLVDAWPSTPCPPAIAIRRAEALFAGKAKL